MHKRAAAAYHQVHHSHDTQPFFYPTTANIHDPNMFSSHPKLVPVHQFNHTVPQQEVLISPSSRNGGVSSTAGSSLPSNKPNSHATPLKGASSSKGIVIDETQTTHVPFEQRFLLSILIMNIVLGFTTMTKLSIIPVANLNTTHSKSLRIIHLLGIMNR